MFDRKNIGLKKKIIFQYAWDLCEWKDSLNDVYSQFIPIARPKDDMTLIDELTEVIQWVGNYQLWVWDICWQSATTNSIQKTSSYIY